MEHVNRSHPVDTPWYTRPAVAEPLRRTNSYLGCFAEPKKGRNESQIIASPGRLRAQGFAYRAAAFSTGQGENFSGASSAAGGRNQGPAVPTASPHPAPPPPAHGP